MLMPFSCGGWFSLCETLICSDVSSVKFFASLFKTHTWLLLILASGTFKSNVKRKLSANPARTDSDEIFSGGIIGIESVITAITGTQKDKIDKMVQENQIEIVPFCIYER
jgi:hypothetical protein